ncbi:hypothetical protein [Caulobacter vibrioides]|uniref:hypothetical protein n=1 Tax=Caulobacter vibrioides TaxID=155892 RepID=UPI000BB4DCB6|nr:hypothetical protein [Caulobacter vibrioides]ATC26510.1 hypothetical protein CA608_19235 [Caulobacter vibrioides]PLR12332.1 hypothetical protein CVUC_08865 [Caulobacter vibrioides]
MARDLEFGTHVGTVYRHESEPVLASQRLLGELLERDVEVETLFALAGPNDVLHWLLSPAGWATMSPLFAVAMPDVRAWLVGKALDAGAASLKTALSPKAEKAARDAAKILQGAIQGGDTVHFGVSNPHVFRGGAAIELQGATEDEIIALVKILGVVAGPINAAIEDLIDENLTLNPDHGRNAQAFIHYPTDGVLRVRVTVGVGAERTLEFPFAE